MSEVKDEVVEEVVEESVEEAKGVEEVLAEELSSMREGDESSETTVAEEGESEGDNASGAEEGSGGVSEEDEEAWLANQSERSQERYRQLAERARAAEEEASRVRAQGQELYKIMGDSGVTPDDMTAYFEYHKNLRNGGDPSQYWEQLERAHSQYTGSKVGNADPLNNHPDLQAKVEEFEVTEEAARELASLRDYSERMRDMEQQQAEANAQYGAETQQYQEAATYAQSASVELDRWSEDMKAKDPQFSQKEALLLERAQEQFPNIHPAYWPQFIANEYAYISKAFPAEASAPAPNAIRPGSTGGGNLQPESKNISEALTNALRDMRD